MKYCIFGGSFDPPHAGHCYLAQTACDSLHLDKIFWVPTPDPPHKSRPQTPFQHRVEMVKQFVAHQLGHEVSDIEGRLSQPSYSLNTIRALKTEKGPDHQWYFLIGADNWKIFPTWHRGPEVLKEVTLVVFPRDGYALETLPEGVLLLNQSEMHIQSREMRETLLSSKNFDLAQVPIEIRAYILHNQLYGMGPVK